MAPSRRPPTDARRGGAQPIDGWTADALPRRPHLTDVARLVGVHPSTVSRALDPAKWNLVHADTRERVRAVADRLGYTPHALARGLRRGRTMSVGVIVADVANPFASDLLAGITGTLEESSYTPLIAQTHDEPGRLAIVLRNLRDQRVDAIIVAAARRTEGALIRASVDPRTSLVLAVRAVEDEPIATVTHDDFAGGQLAAAHLAALGHRLVAQLQGPDTISSFFQRALGFTSAATAAGLRVREVRGKGDGPNPDEGSRLMERLLSRKGHRPSAVFAHNDWMAIGAIDVLRAHGLACPSDVSVIGYNDAPLSDHLSPPLSSIRYAAREIGRAAAEVALTRIEDPTAGSVSVSFAPELVIRESTAPPPKAAPLQAPLRARRRAGAKG